MSQPTPTTPPQKQPQGLLAGVISTPFRLFGVLTAALMLSILLEWAGIAWFWPEQNWHHARDMFNDELLQLSNNFIRSAIVQEPVHTIHAWVKQAYQWVFVNTGLADSIKGTSRRASIANASQTHDFRYYVSVAYGYGENYLIAAAYRVLVFLARLLVLCLTLPLFLLAAFVGLVDGLVRRDLRRFGAGRESGFVYHRARASVMPLAMLPWVIYLALPVSVHPLWVLLPCAFLLGLAVNIAAGSFKKYL